MIHLTYRSFMAIVCSYLLVYDATTYPRYLGLDGKHSFGWKWDMAPSSFVWAMRAAVYPKHLAVDLPAQQQGKEEFFKKNGEAGAIIAAMLLLYFGAVISTLCVAAALDRKRDGVMWHHGFD
jgi:hypothetical protein